MLATQLKQHTLDQMAMGTGECTCVKSSPGNTRWERVEWGYHLKNQDSSPTFCMILWLMIPITLLCLSFSMTLKAIHPTLLLSNRYMDINSTQEIFFYIFIVLKYVFFFPCWFWLCKYFLQFLSKCHHVRFGKTFLLVNFCLLVWSRPCKLINWKNMFLNLLYTCTIL